METASRFLAGFLLGSLIGASTALLLAPKSGEELRGQISDEATRIKDEVKKAASDRRTELEQQLTALRAPSKTDQI
ncbi:MAG: YtxH domain-containing protein [Anaerolineales bacterium]